MVEGAPPSSPSSSYAVVLISHSKANNVHSCSAPTILPLNEGAPPSSPPLSYERHAAPYGGLPELNRYVQDARREIEDARLEIEDARREIEDALQDAESISAALSELGIVLKTRSSINCDIRLPSHGGTNPSSRS